MRIKRLISGVLASILLISSVPFYLSDVNVGADNHGLEYIESEKRVYYDNEGAIANEITLGNNGTTVEQFASLLCKSYYDAGITGELGDCNTDIQIMLDLQGKQIVERADCTGFINAIIKGMGYYPPHQTEFGDATIYQFINSESWTSNDPQILDQFGNKAAEWQRLNYEKDRVLPGDILVRPGHAEIATGWDGEYLYGLNFGNDIAIRNSIKAAEYILDGEDPLNACILADSKLSPSYDLGNGKLGYTYIYRYLPDLEVDLTDKTALIYGAPLSADESDSVKGSGATVIAAIQAALAFQAAGITGKDGDYSQSDTRTLTFGEHTLKTRSDCSGYMTAVMYLLGGENALGRSTGDMSGKELSPQKADGTMNPDWVAIRYKKGMAMQPGDIMVTYSRGHTEMYYGEKDGKWYGFNYGGDDGDYSDTPKCGISAANRASMRIANENMEIIDALVEENSKVWESTLLRGGTTGWVWRYTGDGKGTKADEWGLLKGYNFNGTQSETQTTFEADPDATDYEDWVRVKDMFRHGGQFIGVEQDASEDGEWIEKDYKLGDATGKYVISIGDKKYYWYHQTATTDNCTYCGDWTSMLWGSEMVNPPLGMNGSPIYAAAIAVSNLTNTDTTPIDILSKLGVKVSGDRRSADTSTCDLINNNEISDPDAYIKKIGELYSLEVGENLGGLSESDAQVAVDAILDKGGLVVMQVTGKNESGWWPENDLTNHYTTIYKKDSEGYYLLDQTFNEGSENFSKAVDFSTIYKNQSSYIYGLINPNPPKIKVKKSGNFGNGTWYGDGSAISQASGKEDLGDGFYLYNGLPWPAGSDTYTVDCRELVKSLYNYVTTVSPGVTPTKADGSAVDLDKIFEQKCMYADPSWYPQGGSWSSSGGGKYTTIDSVKCIAVCVMPVVVDRDYNNNFGNYSETGGTTKYNKGKVNTWMLNYEPEDSKGAYDYGNKKMCMIVKKRSDDSVWYLPCTNVDAKGHTFPGGVCQTDICLAKKGWHKLKCDIDSNGAPTTIHVTVAKGAGIAGDFGYSWDKPISSLGELMNKADKGRESYGSSWEKISQMVEPWSVPNAVKTKVIKSDEYQMIGYVVWEE